jgi:hypothetical protein
LLIIPSPLPFSIFGPILPRFLQDIGTHVSNYIVSHPRRLQSWCHCHRNSLSHII